MFKGKATLKISHETIMLAVQEYLDRRVVGERAFTVLKVKQPSEYIQEFEVEVEELPPK